MVGDRDTGEIRSDSFLDKRSENTYRLKNEYGREGRQISS
jgi:hypothetical protein